MPPENSTPNASGNPLATGMQVTVFIPQEVKIKLVDASLLGDFELWIFIASLLFNCVTGFWVAFFTLPKDSPVVTFVLIVSIIWSVLFAVAAIVAAVKRKKIHQTSRDIELTTTPNPASLQNASDETT